MIARLMGIAALSGLAAACAAPSEEPVTRTAQAEQETGSDCFFLSQVSGYTVSADRKIRVSTGPRHTYEFETLGGCPDLNRGNAIALDKKGPGTICRGIDVDLIVPTSIGPQRCPVRMIRRIEMPQGS